MGSMAIVLSLPVSLDSSGDWLLPSKRLTINFFAVSSNQYKFRCSQSPAKPVNRKSMT